MFRFILLVFLSLIVFNACGGSNCNSSSSSNGSLSATENIRMSHIHHLFHKNHKNYLDSELDYFFKKNRQKISEEIDSSAEESNYNLSKEAHKLILRGIEQAFYIKANNEFLNSFSIILSEKHKDFLQEIDIDDESKHSLYLTQGEEERLILHIKDFYQENKSDLDLMYQIHLDKAKESYLSDSSNSLMTLFSQAEEGATFNKKMSTYFTHYNPEDDYNSSNHHSPMNQHFHNKMEITNTFDGKILSLYKPIFEGGKIVKVDKEKITIIFPDKDNSKPKSAQHYLAVSADINGDGHASLIVLKQYENEKYYPFEIDHNGELKTDIAIEPMRHITDIASGDLDGDGAYEIIIAQGSPFNKVTLFDDAREGFKYITTFSFSNAQLEDGVIRIASGGDVDADGYDEFAAVLYNTKAQSWNTQLYMWSINKENPTLLETRINYQFDQKTPVDILFSDLHSVDKIDLFAVQLRKKNKNESTGYYQPKQSGSDDYCIYYMESTNYLHVYEFAYNFKQNKFIDSSQEIAVRNHTYDKKYNNGNECLKDKNGFCIYNSKSNKYPQKDGVICILGGCKCDTAIIPYLHPYHLYTKYDDTFKPIYATAYHESLNSPAKLDIDGLKYDYAGSTKVSTTVIYPAEYSHYKYGIHKKGSHHYIPVRTNSGENNDRKYVAHMKEGNRNYKDSSIPRAASGESITSSSVRGYVHRSYNEKEPHIGRVSTYANNTKILKFKQHHLLYSKPTIAYLLAPPPPVSKDVKMTYSLGHCSGTVKKDTALSGQTWGASVSFGIDIDFIVGDEGKWLATAEVGSTQSSGSVEEHKQETCIETSHSLTSDDDYIAYYYANILDSYEYTIIKNDSDTANIGKSIFINQKRLGNSIPYNAQTGIKDLYEKLDAAGIEPDINVTSLIRHQEGNLSNYYTQTAFDNIVLDPASNLSDKFFYSHLWHTKQNVMIPNEGGISNAYTKTISHTYGTEEHDTYEASVEFEAEFEEGLIASAVEKATLKTGREWAFRHEDLTEDSTETSYELEIEGDGTVDTLDNSYIGIFSYIAIERGDNCYNNDSIPLNRYDFLNFNRDNIIQCKPPVLVIDYWLTNSNESDE